MIETKRFKVLKTQQPYMPSSCPDSIPWRFIEPFKERAFKNHDQSLEQLNQRGGLSPQELFFILQDKPFGKVSIERAVDFLLWKIVVDFVIDGD